MTRITLPLWVYAGILWAGISATGLGYFSAQQVETIPTAPHEPYDTDIQTALKTNNIAFTTSGNTTTFITEDVYAIFQLLQKNRIRINLCHISAQAQNYQIRLETQP